MPNEVNITITAEDLTGHAFDSVLGKVAKLRAELALLKGDLDKIGDIKIGVDQSSLIGLRSRLQSLGIADLADVNIPPGRLMTQLQLLKRLIGQAGISDMLDVNVNEASLGEALHRISGITETIPLRFRVQQPQMPERFFVASQTGLPTVIPGAANLANTLAAAAAATRNLGAAEAAQAVDANASAASLLAQAAAAGNAKDAAKLAYAAQVAMNIAGKEASAPVSEYKQWLDKATFSERAFTNALSAGLPIFNAGGAGWGFLTGGVHMFGGAVDQLFPKMPVWISHLIAFTANWHLLAEAIIETAGTLIPAAIAFGVFAAASIPTFKDLYSQVKNVFQANQALGQNVRPLTGAFQALAQAVQPEVYTLFGEAILIANHNTGAFRTIALGAGKVLDDLGARFTLAATKGTAFGTIAQHAAADLQIWGAGIGNVGGIIADFLKVLPGYAQMIGYAFDAATHSIETLLNTPVAQSILSIGLAAHGAIFYIGLLSTAFALLMTKGLSSLAPLLLNIGVGLEKIGVTGAASAMGNFAASAEKAAGLPWGWISVAAAALGFLVYRLVTAKDGIQQLFASMQQGLQQAPLTSLTTLLNTDLTKTAQALANANNQLKQFAANNQLAADAAQRGFSGIKGPAGSAIEQYNQLAKNSADYAAGLKELQGDQQTVNQHIKEAAGIFGGAANAWAILNGAGVTSAQVLSKDKATWAEALIEAQAFQQTLLIGTGGVNGYNAALNALNFAAGNSKNALGQIVSAMQPVIQAQDQITSTLIAGQQQFVSFQQTIVGTMGQGGKAVGGLAADAKIAGAAIGGLNVQSLQMAGDFYSQAIPAAQKMIDALRNEGTTTKDLTPIVATMAGQLLTFAGNNEGARVAVIDLINNALDPGTVSLKNLNSWVKNNSTSLQGFQNDVTKAELAASHLAGVLEQNLTAQFHADLLATSHADDALKAYTQSIVNNQQNTINGQSQRAALIRDLINSGLSAKQATSYVNGLATSIANLHDKTVTITVNTVQTSSGGGGGGKRHNAIGGPVTLAAFGGPRENQVMVGEEGPEIVNLPPGSWVNSHSDSVQMAYQEWGSIREQRRRRHHSYPNVVLPGLGDFSQIRLQVDPSGSTAFEMFMVQAIREWVRIKGGGDVQKAFGRT